VEIANCSGFRRVQDMTEAMFSVGFPDDPDRSSKSALLKLRHEYYRTWAGRKILLGRKKSLRKSRAMNFEHNC
jgi:hypothetical protein